MQRIILILGLVLVFVGSASGQTSTDSTDEDPFENDPFFSTPIENFFKNSDSPKPPTADNKNIQSVVKNINDEGLDFRGVFKAGPYNSSTLYSVYPNLPMIHYNRVNSLFLGITKERMQWHQSSDWLGIPKIQLHGLIGYATGQSEWQYSLGFEKLFGKNNHVLIGGGFHDAATTNDQWRVGLNETSISAFTGGYDYLDYYKQKGWGAYLLTRTDRFFEGGIAFSDDRFNSLNKETNWALFGAGNRFRSNPTVHFSSGMPVDTVDISSITISATFNPKKLAISNSFTFSLSANAEFSDPGIGTSSDFEYAKYTGELISYLNFGSGTVLKHRFRIYSITGEAPRFKQLYLGGVGTLRALPYKSMSGNQQLLSNAELQFGNPGIHSGDWIDFDDFYLSVFLDSGWSDYHSKLRDNSNPFSGLDRFSVPELSHNAGIGLGSSFLRGELAWDLNNTASAPVFWIRFNPTF